MRLALFVLTIFIQQICHTQSTYVRVLGMHYYDKSPTSLYIDYPINATEATTMNRFLDSINSIKSIQEIDQYENTYRLILNSGDDYNEIQEIERSFNLKGKAKYLYRKNFIGEDSLAINAFENAKERAMIIANHLNMSLGEIVNIDDKVEVDEFYSELFRDADDKEFFKEILGDFKICSQASPYKSKPSLEARYGLWVTFKLDE